MALEHLADIQQCDVRSQKGGVLLLTNPIDVDVFLDLSRGGAYDWTIVSPYSCIRNDCVNMCDFCSLQGRHCILGVCL